MSKLFIIGNGFDLFHNLPTSACDFCSILSQKRIYDDCEDALSVFLNYGVDWGDFEDSLSYIDPNLIEESVLSYPDYLSDHESDRDGTILYTNKYLNSMGDIILESLSDMVNTANEQLNITTPRINNLFCESDVILSFNYTSTLEKLYDVGKLPILHIHGYKDNNEELIFGYKNAKYTQEYSNRIFSPYDDGRDYYTDKQKESILEFCNSWKKRIKLKELSTFLNHFNGIDQVYVLGHSMSLVDSDYMELIEKMINPVVWYISQHDNKPNIRQLSIYSFINKVELFDFESINNIFNLV